MSHYEANPQPKYLAQPQAWAGLTLDRPRIMGVLNVTPDSFSDGGLHSDPIAAGLAMAAEGADIIDVGGESTRPGAAPTEPEIERERVIPVIRTLARHGLRISIDTRNARTMHEALDAGATIVNDISALTHDPAAAPLVASRGCAVVLMHMRGTPDTMLQQAIYTDVGSEVAAELNARLNAALAAGIKRDSIALDPGIGFAKYAPQSIAILRALPTLAALGYPLLIGASRKSFIGRISGEPDASKRFPGSIAAGLFALSRGAAILRVHDVRETVQALSVWTVLTAESAT